MTGSLNLMVVVTFSAALGAQYVWAGPINASHHPHPDQARAVHEAEHAVDHAWEVYHRAALGGTIASPILQVEIEEHLHEARTLVAQAQEAAERGDHQRAERMVGEIHIHAFHAIEGSKERKQ